MIAKLGGDLKDGRGRSFKELFRYLFFDKRGSSLSRRVDWAETVNCTLAGDPRRAWFEMFTTWAARTALKLAAGIALTGRDNSRPVLHLSLAWAPHQAPDKREMMAAAHEVLDWLDLSEHQAVVVAHNDEPQPHIHLVVNTVHPLTGKTASLYQCKRTLSAWAVQWEERHGGILVESRVMNRLARTRGPKETAPTDAPTSNVYSLSDQFPVVAPAPVPSRPGATNDNMPEAVSSSRPPRAVAPPKSLRAYFRRLAFVLAVAVPIVALFAHYGGTPARGHAAQQEMPDANKPSLVTRKAPGKSRYPPRSLRL